MSSDRVDDRHDPAVLEAARAALDDCSDTAAMRDLVLGRVRANEQWRGGRCVNLVAAEAPTSPLVRSLLSAEAGTRASGGAIGRNRRWFAAMSVVDEIEATCVELLKRLYGCAFADHRPLGGMHACLVAYSALTQPGERAPVLTLGPDGGGDSSHTREGPPGALGLRVAHIPVDREGRVDLDRFASAVREHRPRVIGIGETLSLFPQPVREMSDIARGHGARLYFDGAHQAGLIAGGVYPDPLRAGADLLTASAGKTFCGPQGGFVLWNDPELTGPVAHAIFPVLTGSHQINRVAALAVGTVEMLEFGKELMSQVVANARRLARALQERGLPVLFAERGFTATHQLIVDARGYGGGAAAAHRLAAANLVVNQQPLPGAGAGAEPGGIRLGTTEVTRLGMGAGEMDGIADFIADVLAEADPSDSRRMAAIGEAVARFRAPFQTIYYCHANGTP